MATTKTHDYHILPPSIWPFLAAVSVFFLLFGAVLWMHDMGMWMFALSLLGCLAIMYAWWADVVREAQAGDHTPVVRIGLRYGFILFILSEVAFFGAWFWSVFKHLMYPMETFPGSEYAPPEITPINAFELPLINTVILLLSGCAVTWAHHALVHDGPRQDVANGLLISVVLGVAFTLLQGYEYYHLVHDIGYTLGGDEFYANFFLPTGFHGLHVIIGTLFLLVCYMRVRAGHFTAERHIGLEAAAWYWHFVDVVWLFLFFVVYIWGM